MEAIEISDGIRRITIRPDSLVERRMPPQATGARVTIEFARAEPLPDGCSVCLVYDLAENGQLRELLGQPQLTHTESAPQGQQTHHYRVSCWVPPERVMEFVLRPAVLTDACAA